MQITISEDSMMYIYLKDSEKHRHERTKTRSDICCFLLYDAADNLLGIRIINKQDDDESQIDIQLPRVGNVEFSMYNAIITESEQKILILFNQDTLIAKESAHTCTIDVCKTGIIGIEPLPYVNVGGKEMMKPFIIRDEANPVYYVLSRPAKCSCSSNSFAETKREHEDLEMHQGYECVECGQVYFLMGQELGKPSKNADMTVEEALRISREKRGKGRL